MANSHGVRIRGRDVVVDGQVVAKIVGSRDPNGKNHEGYWIRTVDGRKIGYYEKSGKGLFAYADDVKKDALANPGDLLPLDAVIDESEDRERPRG